MVKFIKEYWFGLLVSVFFFIFMLVTIIIAVAPHDDAEMRGFTPCTYQMADELGQLTEPKFKEVFYIIHRGYGCYFSVMAQGIKQYATGKQATPWANYLFQPITLEPEDGEIKELSEELLSANRLDKDDPEKGELFGDLQEKNDEK